MKYQVTLTKTVTVDAENVLRAITVAEHHTGGKATAVHSEDSGETRYVIERCEGCQKPMLDNDNSGAHWDDGVRTCGECTGLEPGERAAGRPTLTVVS